MAFGKNDIIKLIASIIICQLTGIVGSFFTRLSVGTWYATIQKHFFTPPGWLCAPVWVSFAAVLNFSILRLN